MHREPMRTELFSGKKVKSLNCGTFVLLEDPSEFTDVYLFLTTTPLIEMLISKSCLPSSLAVVERQLGPLEAEKGEYWNCNAWIWTVQSTPAFRGDTLHFQFKHGKSYPRPPIPLALINIYLKEARARMKRGKQIA